MWYYGLLGKWEMKIKMNLIIGILGNWSLFGDWNLVLGIWQVAEKVIIFKAAQKCPCLRRSGYAQAGKCKLSLRNPVYGGSRNHL